MGAGALTATLLYLAIFSVIVLSGNGRTFLASENRWSAPIATGVLALFFGGALGYILVEANETREKDEKKAKILHLGFNGGVMLLMGLIFGRLTRFNWSFFLDSRPQASAFLAVILLASILIWPGLIPPYGKKRCGD
ncbi:hypothetical protein EON80_08360 [bacterium]|nr:MAG: hypothetical protein EON80_08360 [bacterium]